MTAQTTAVKQTTQRPNVSKYVTSVSYGFSMRYKPVWLIEAAPKTFFLFGCLKET